MLMGEGRCSERAQLPSMGIHLFGCQSGLEGTSDVTASGAKLGGVKNLL